MKNKADFVRLLFFACEAAARLVTSFFLEMQVNLNVSTDIIHIYEGKNG
jgi:hypothetical protein